MSGTERCRKCGETFGKSVDLSMHNLVVHSPDALYIHTNEERESQ